MYVFGINDSEVILFSTVTDLLCPQPSRECPQETEGPCDWLYGSLLPILPSSSTGPRQAWEQEQCCSATRRGWPLSNYLRILQPASRLCCKPRASHCPSIASACLRPDPQSQSYYWLPWTKPPLTKSSPDSWVWRLRPLLNWTTHITSPPSYTHPAALDRLHCRHLHHPVHTHLRAQPQRGRWERITANSAGGSVYLTRPCVWVKWGRAGGPADPSCGPSA